MIKSIPGVSVKELRYGCCEYALYVAVDKGNGQEPISRKIFEKSDPSTSKEVLNPYKHLHDTGDMHFLFGGGALIREVSWFSPISPLLRYE